jgi:phage baseplate assembly protein V
VYRRGIVEEVDAATCRVRVRFPQEQDLLSGWLDVLQGSTHEDKYYRIPPKGNQVAVLLDEQNEAGCVLGAVYSTADAPPADADNVVVVTLSDGFEIKYNKTTHVLAVTVPSGGSLELCGSSSLVALATKVETELKAFVNDYKAHGHIAGTLLLSAAPGSPVTGTTGAPVAVSYAVGAVGAAQLKSG